MKTPRDIVATLVFERGGARFAVPTRHVEGVGEAGQWVLLPAARAPFVGVVRRGDELALGVDLGEGAETPVSAATPVFARRGAWLIALVADRVVGLVDLQLDGVVHPALVAGREDIDLFHAVAMDFAGMTLVANLAAIEGRAIFDAAGDATP